MNTSLRIAFLVDTYTVLTKGVHHASGLASELIRRGHTVRCFGAPSGRLPSSPTVVDGAAGQAGEFAEVQAEGADPGGGVKAFAPDLVLAYDALSPAAWLGARCAKRFGMPLVLVEPGSYLRGSLWDRSLWRMGEVFFGPSIRRHFQKLLAVDPAAQALALEEGFSESSVHLLPIGVDTEMFAPGLPSEVLSQRRITGRFVAYAGRLEPKRGVDLLLAAFARTVGRRGDWSLVLSGKGEHIVQLRAMAERAGVAASVHFLPKLPESDLAGLLSNATLVAIPAQDASVRGISIARAMACGRPVLASDLPRFAHLVQHDVTGLRVQVPVPGKSSEDASVDSGEAWARALVQACGAPQARERWGQAGREFALQNLAWNQVAEQFERLVFPEAQSPRVTESQRE